MKRPKPSEVIAFPQIPTTPLLTLATSLLSQGPLPHCIPHSHLALSRYPNSWPPGVIVLGREPEETVSAHTKRDTLSYPSVTAGAPGPGCTETLAEAYRVEQEAFTAETAPSRSLRTQGPNGSPGGAIRDSMVRYGPGSSVANSSLGAQQLLLPLSSVVRSSWPVTGSSACEVRPTLVEGRRSSDPDLPTKVPEKVAERSHSDGGPAKENVDSRTDRQTPTSPLRDPGATNGAWDSKWLDVVAPEAHKSVLTTVKTTDSEGMSLADANAFGCFSDYSSSSFAFSNLPSTSENGWWFPPPESTQPAETKPAESSPILSSPASATTSCIRKGLWLSSSSCCSLSDWATATTKASPLTADGCCCCCCCCSPDQALIEEKVSTPIHRCQGGTRESLPKLFLDDDVHIGRPLHAGSRSPSLTSLSETTVESYYYAGGQHDTESSFLCSDEYSSLFADPPFKRERIDSCDGSEGF